MEFALNVVGYVLGIPLELLVIGALLSGGYRRFPFVFGYTLAYFFTSVIEMPLYWGAYAPWLSQAEKAPVLKRLVTWYWRDETALQVLVFAVVMSLVWEASANTASRRVLRAALMAFVILLAGISFLVHFNPDPKALTGLWMTLWARDLNLTASIVDLAVWTMLVASRHRDPRVLLLTSGLGIEFAGEAIGESLRSMSHTTEVAGGILSMLTNLVFLYLWWQTFRAPRVAKVAARPRAA
jgi:hypothetical protein